MTPKLATYEEHHTEVVPGARCCHGCAHWREAYDGEGKCQARLVRWNAEEIDGNPMTTCDFEVCNLWEQTEEAGK